MYIAPSSTVDYGDYGKFGATQSSDLCFCSKFKPFQVQMLDRRGLMRIGMAIENGHRLLVPVVDFSIKDGVFP